MARLLAVWVTCAFCRGTGADPRHGAASRCPACGVNRMIAVRPPAVSCPACAGSGREAAALPCGLCGGAGVVSDRYGSGQLASDPMEEVG